MKGFLVSFEGGEGCGKSTQIKRFIKYLENNNHEYICTREPGGTPVGEEIRNILLHSKDNLSPKTEFLLFSASRNKLIEDVVKPALDQGKVVVLDRYYDSSYTYQGYAGNLRIEDIKTITNFAISGAVPDVTFLLDLPYEEGMNRKSKDEALKNLDRIEQKDKQYHDSVRNGYLTIAKDNPNRVVVIDASQSPEQIERIIQAEFISRHKKY
ncbi:MAG: dTMP kinase [Clostridia bacterium]|nr:dTMP kinase [Clostridia bacterium]